MRNDSISTKLQELFDLFKNGTITNDEYSQLKSELLNENHTSIIEGNDSINQNNLNILVKKTIFEDKLKDEPLNVIILQEYAQFLFNNLFFDEAITVTLKILTINETDALTKELLFKLYLKVNRFNDALETGEQLLNEKPTDILLIEELARISSELGDSNKVKVYYDKILSIQPTNTTALQNNAINLLNNNQLEEAIEIFEKIYTEGQSDNITTIYAGIGKALKGDYQVAFELLSKSIITNNELQNDINNNRCYLYLTYSLCYNSSDMDVISDAISQYFHAIDFKLLKHNYHFLDERTAIKTIEYLVKIKLIYINPNINQITESYLNLDYFTEKSNLEVANIWYTICEKHVELKQLGQALDSIQKAIYLLPDEKKYQEKYIDIENLIVTETQKRKRNRIIIIFSVFVGLILIVFSIFSYKIIEEKKSFKLAKLGNTASAYQSYLDVYPEGKHFSEIKQLKEKYRWEKAKALSSVDGYDSYLLEYPNGKYASLVKDYEIAGNFIIEHDFVCIKNGISFSLKFNSIGINSYSGQAHFNLDSFELVYDFKPFGKSIELTFISSNNNTIGSSTTATLNKDNTISMNYKGQELVFKPN